MPTYTYTQDPAHGWIEVPVTELDALGIADRITTYSYRSRDGLLAYLEEDQDATTWVRAYRDAHGVVPAVKEVHVNHTPIRGYPRF